MCFSIFILIHDRKSLLFSLSSFASVAWFLKCDIFLLILSSSHIIWSITWNVCFEDVLCVCVRVRTANFQPKYCSCLCLYVVACADEISRWLPNGWKKRLWKIPRKNSERKTMRVRFNAFSVTTLKTSTRRFSHCKFFTTIQLFASTFPYFFSLFSFAHFYFFPFLLLLSTISFIFRFHQRPFYSARAHQ